MVTLLIIADDFTGALDTGVQFAAYGANTRVVTNVNYDFCQVDPQVQVLVMDTESRHLSASEAYEVIYDITKRADSQKIPYLYKKTDSALRGNIGSELTAMLKAAGRETLSFLPAFPKMNRWNQEGIHYIEGIPVDQSVFGRDPFEPVKSSYIPEIIKSQSQVKVIVKNRLNENNSNEKDTNKSTEETIFVWDAMSEQELRRIGKHLFEKNQMKLTAGCAGFAAVLPELLGLKEEKVIETRLTSRLLVISGSVNPITESQLDYAEKNGFLRIRLKPEESLNNEFWTSPRGQARLEQWKELMNQQRYSCVIFDSNDKAEFDSVEDYAMTNGLSLNEVRLRISASFGYILKNLLDVGNENTIMIIGGDTLLGCMEHLAVTEMEPVCELAPGTVLSNFILDGKKNQIISKSGGFGQETLLVDLASKITGTAK